MKTAGSHPVGVGGPHVNAPRHDRRTRLYLGRQGRPQGREPREFVLIVRILRGATVGHVHRHEPYAAAHRADRPGLRLRISGLVGESVAYVLQTDAREKSNTVPTSLPVRLGRVPEFGFPSAATFVS